MIAAVISTYVRTALYIVGIFAIAFVAAWFTVRKVPSLTTPLAHTTIFLVGTGLLLVAGIGRIGYPLQTFDGNTPAERLDGIIFWVLSVVGTFLLVYDFALAKLSR